MVEISFSRTEKPILKYDGKLLCSGRDPELEARRWIEKIEVRQSNIMVIGVGCGYHLKSLVDRFENINVIGIDSSNVITGMKKNIWKDVLPKRIQLIDRCELKKELVKRNLRSCLRHGFQVEVFRPAISSRLLDFSELYEFLLGRTEEGLKFLLWLMEDYGSVLLDKSGKPALRITKSDPVSIVDVRKMAKNSALAEEKKLILNIMGELVR